MISNFLKNKVLKAFASLLSYHSQLLKEYYDRSGRRCLAVLDVGCGEGAMTTEFVRSIDSCTLYGVDILDKCTNSEIQYKKVELEGGSLPFSDETFDVVHSNQVIEHILDKDFFICECLRVLKKGGLFICGTDNISSIDNIISLILGQEPLSQHTSSKYHSASCLSPYFMMKLSIESGNRYLHKNVCSYYGLQRLARINGVQCAKIRSFGNLCWFFEKLFPMYNRLISINAIKN